MSFVSKDAVAAKAINEVLGSMEAGDIQSVYTPADQPWKIMVRMDLPELGGVKIITLNVGTVVDHFE